MADENVQTQATEQPTKPAPTKAEEPKPEAPQVNPTTPELSVLVRGTARLVEIVDQYGKKHELQALNFNDMCDLEDKIGNLQDRFSEGNTQTLTLKEAGYILWLSLRKEGRSVEDIKAMKWRYTPQEVRMLFSMQQIRYVMEAVTALFTLSHLPLNEIKEANKQNPTEGPAGEDARKPS